MKLQIVAIGFSDESNPGGNTIKIRKNAFEKFPLPEWQRSSNFAFVDVPVAYSINQVRSGAQPVTIKVKFKITEPGNLPKSLVIRAISPAFNAGATIWDTLLQTHVNVLGDVKAQSIIIDKNGKTDFLVFELINHKITLWGVGIYNVIWKWQFRADQHQAWQDFDVTEHTIYTLLNQPTEPWALESEEDMLLPWTDVLDYACTWAGRAKTEDEAAALITRKLYSMGPQWFEYNCINFLPAYIQVINFNGTAFFNCAAFLQHLKFGNVNRYLICSDCATIVSTFANILGCSLWQSKMETPGALFRVNEILPIGAAGFQIPCGLPGFSYHEVAWKGNCTSNDPIFDGCLAIDGTVNPQDNIRWPLLALNMLLGSRGSGLYRDKLVAPPDWNLFVPQPALRERRMPAPIIARLQINETLAAKAEIKEPIKLASIKKQYNFKEWQNYNQLEETLFIDGFFLDVEAFPEWRIQVLNEIGAEATGPGFIHSIWRIPGSLNRAVRVDFYECPSRLSAQEFALQLLVSSHVGTSTIHQFSEVGDIAFQWSGAKNILFTRANMVVLIAMADRLEVPVVALSNQIDDHLCYKPAETNPVKKASTDTKKSAAGDLTNQGVPITLHPDLSNNFSVDEKAGGSLEYPGRVFFKFFSKTGDVTIENGHHIYRATKEGSHRITVVNVYSNRYSVVEDLEIQ